jgi:hypothetical protein
MPVAITWSATQGGGALSEPRNHGSAAAGNTLAAQQIYLWHDGDNQITNCRFYISQYSGSYTGGASAAADFTELLAWGDGATLAAFGGFQVNMDKVGAFPSGAWPTFSSKQPSNGSAFYTGVGNLVDNAILLPTAMGLTSPGVLQTGTPDVAFQCRVHIPSAEGTLGIRQFDQKLRYTYTS